MEPVLPQAASLVLMVTPSPSLFCTFRLIIMVNGHAWRDGACGLVDAMSSTGFPPSSYSWSLGETTKTCDVKLSAELVQTGMVSLLSQRGGASRPVVATTSSRTCTKCLVYRIILFYSGRMLLL